VAGPAADRVAARSAGPYVADTPRPPDCEPRLRDGDPQLPEGEPRLHGGEPRFPDGEPQLPDGEPQIPDGELRPPDDELPVRDGEPRLPDGEPRVPDGELRLQDGEPRPPDGEPEADPAAVAREICLRLLTERARTRQELAQALRKRGVPDEAAHTVLERFDEVGLIDDAAFAGQWVRSRHTRRGLARRAIAVELRHKGVADEVAQEALAEVDPAAEEQRARELVERKLRTVPADTPERRAAAARRLVGMLARRGYSGGIAYRVVREALAAHGAEDDELGPEPDI
jgi:regulatory protein